MTSIRELRARARGPARRPGGGRSHRACRRFGQVPVDRTRRQHQPVRDLSVGQTGGDQLETSCWRAVRPAGSRRAGGIGPRGTRGTPGRAAATVPAGRAAPPSRSRMASACKSEGGSSPSARAAARWYGAPRRSQALGRTPPVTAGLESVRVVGVRHRDLAAGPPQPVRELGLQGRVARPSRVGVHRLRVGHDRGPVLSERGLLAPCGGDRSDPLQLVHPRGPARTPARAAAGSAEPVRIRTEASTVRPTQRAVGWPVSASSAASTPRPSAPERAGSALGCPARSRGCRGTRRARPARGRRSGSGSPRRAVRRRPAAS